jgi:hypothetical protein
MNIIQLHDGSVLVLDDDKKLTKLDNPSGKTIAVQLEGEVNSHPGEVWVDGKKVSPKE